jgi:hypothetical protein
LAGVIFGTAIFPKLHKRTKATAKDKVQQHLIKPYELAKAELESLKFEKSLLQQAIAKIYEAVREGRIDATERDRLLLKYKHQLAIYNEKIDALLPLVDFSELSDMRDDVVDLLEKRITDIDKRLIELSKKSKLSYKGSSAFNSKGTSRNTLQITEKKRWQQGQELAEGEEEARENETGGQLLTEDKHYASHIQHNTFEQEHDDKKQYHISYRRESASEYTSEEKNIERVQHEIMEALSRLEQTAIDNDNEYESGNETSDNNDRGNNFVTARYTDITSKTTDKSCLRKLIKD